MKIARFGFACRLAVLSCACRLLGFGACAQESIANSGDSYRVTGVAQFKWLMQGDERFSPPAHFICAVNEDQWAITITRSETNAFDYEQTTFDGRSLYHVISIESAVRKRQNEGGRIAGNVATAFVASGEISHSGMTPEVGPIWLAFASRNFFRNISSGFAEPPLAFDGTGHTYDEATPKKLRILHSLLADSGLPESVVYLDDGVTLLGGHFPAPYDKGFTNCAYHVSSFTNINGLTLPVSANLILYAPKASGMSERDLQVAGVYELVMHAIEFGAGELAVPPKLPGPTAVSDGRMKDLPGLFYWATNRWPSPEEIAANPDFLAKVQAYADSPAKARPSTALTRLLFVAMGVVSLIGILWILYKQKNAGKERAI